MTTQIYSQALAAILTAEKPPHEIFAALLPALGELLQCDRCFLYVRNPRTQMGRVIECWRLSPNYPLILDPEWKSESDSLPQDDPLFAAALRTDPSIFIEDVETAAPNMVNREFEHRVFGHRALIHAHLCQEQQLWGILQPCVFEYPRVWTEDDRAVITQVEQQLTPLVVTYVQSIQPEDLRS
jgi:GAF domain-containing protein